MKFNKAFLFVGWALFTLATPLVFAQTAQTNLAVIVRHAPNLNGGTIQGSVQQLNGEGVNVNSGFVLTGDFLLPGTPTLRLNGSPVYSGTIAGSGSTSPAGYLVTLNSGCSLRYLLTRTTPIALSTVSAPPSPTGTRSVNINSVGQSYGDAATLRDLTLNGNVGLIAVPPGTYGNFNVSGGSGLVLGVAGGLQAVSYNLQTANFNSGSTLKIVGPVVLTVANGFTANGIVGATNNPDWLQLRVANGGLTLNSGSTVAALVQAPNGSVMVNGNSRLIGTSASDQFTLNSGGMVCWGGTSSPTTQLPTAAAQTVTLLENGSTNLTLTGTDPLGGTLRFTVLTAPAHGTISGTPPSVTYQPATNFFGSDSFTFKVSNGSTDSAPATISLVVNQVFYPPTAFSQSLVNLEDTALPVTLAGYDPQGDTLAFSVLTQPAHGTLTGAAPNLVYLPVTNYFGNDSFTFRVNNGYSNSVAASVSITNQPVDDLPLVVAGADQLIILPANAVSLAGSVTYDVFPGAVDTVLWSKVSGPGSVTFSNPTNTLTTATFSQSGIYRLRLLASDSFQSDSSDLSVTVDAPPVVSAGAATTNVFPGTIVLSGTASDDGLPTNGVLTTVWSLVSGPGTVVFGNAAVTNTSVTFGTNGMYVLRLTADDGVATNHAEITVIENLPPLVNAGSSILTNGLNANLNGSVADDGWPSGWLSVQWSQSSGPGTVTFGDATATNSSITASQSGTYVLILTATDSSATNSSEVTVTFNQPPVVTAGLDQTVNAGGTVNLAGMVSDDQLPHDTLTSLWTKVSGPGSVTFADASLTNTTVTFDQPGVYTLRLTASDTLATAVSEVVVRVNAAPVVLAGNDQLVTLGKVVTLTGSFTDDGIPSSAVGTLWSQISGPAGAVVADPTAVTTTVSFTQSGAYVFQLAADDGLTNGQAQVMITVDQAPVVTAGAPILLNWPANQVVLRGTVTDDGLPNGGSLTSVWRRLSGPGAVILATPVTRSALNGSATISQPETVAVFTAPGLYMLRLTGNDGVATNHADVVVTVNQAPAVSAGASQSSVSPGSLVTLNGTATDDGLPSGSVLTTIWSKVSGPGTVTFGNVGATNSTASFDQAGVYVLRLSASDSVVATTAEVSLTVTSANQAPVVNAGSLQTNLWSLPVQLSGTVTDDGAPSGTALATTWSVISGPAEAVFDNASLTNATVTFSRSGVYVLQLVASDSQLAASNQVVIVADAAPLVTAGTDLVVTDTNQVSLTGTVIDDGLPLGTLTGSWSLVSGPGTATFQPAVGTNALTGVTETNQFSTAATFSTGGVYVLSLTADDGLVTNAAQVVITVNQSPLVDAGTNQTVQLGQSVSLQGFVADDGLPAGGSLAVGWSLASGPGTVMFGNSAATNTTAVFEQAGTYVLRLSADDSVSVSTSDVIVTVQNLGETTNRPPEVSAGVSQTILFPAAVHLAGAIIDDGLPAGVALSTRWSTVSGPGTVTFDNASETNATAVFSQPGIYVLQLTGFDTQLSTSKQVVIIADNSPMVDFGGDRSVVGTNQILLVGTVSDDGLPSGAELTAVWDVVGGPGPVGITPSIQKNAIAGTNATFKIAATAIFAQPGDYDIRLTVDDSFATNSVTRRITFKRGPVVSFIAPVDGSYIPVGQPLPIELTASDDCGQVTNVTLFDDGAELTKLEPNQFTTTWNTATLGMHVLSATVVDDQGIASVSTNITVFITPTQSGDFSVEAGADQVIELSQTAVLSGAVNIPVLIDGAVTNLSWTKISGPGDVKFKDSTSLTTAAQFSAPGTYTLWLNVAYGGGNRLGKVNVDVLSNPTSQLTAAKSSKGTDFWLTKLYRGYSSSDVGNEWYVLIAAETDTDVQIVSPRNDLFDTTTNYVHVKGGTIKRVIVGDPGDGFFWDAITGLIVNDSVHVMADAPVSVYGLVRDISTADGYLALPTSFLGTNYMVLSYYGASGFALVATEDDTKVTIVPTADYDNTHLAGQPWQVSMQRGQTFRVEKWDVDFTGTTVASDKPIAVFGGDTGANVPTNYPYSDYLIEQMTPINTWGQHFATMPLATRLHGDTFRFLAAADGTKVSVNGMVVADLDQGQFFEQIIEKPSVILSTHPILVGQFANGTAFDEIMGDPFMMLVPPVEQFGGNYLIDAASLNGILNWWEDQTVDYVSYLNLIVYGSGTNSVLLNNIAVPAGQFQQIGDSDYFGAQLAVSNISYKVSSPFPVGVCVYGWAPYESYAFMGGLFSASVDADKQLTLTQTTGFGAVGGEKFVAAHVVNMWGRPVPDMEISFSVAGVNPTSGRVITSRFGDAIFTWIGTAAGEDVVTARMGDYQQSLTNSWILPLGNTPPMVTTTDTATLQYGLAIKLLGKVDDREQSIGSGLQQHWELLSGPGDVIFNEVSNAMTLATCSVSGLYQFELVANDSQFSSRSVVKVQTDIIPTVQFSMDETSILTVGSEIQLSALVADDDDGIERVEFYVNGGLAGIGTPPMYFYYYANYEMPWTPPTNGWYTFQAVAYDYFGGVATSAVYTVRADYAPVLAIGSISDGMTVTVPTNVIIHAAAFVQWGAVTSLAVYANGQELGTSTNGDLTINWIPQRKGDYTFYAVATDDAGLSTTTSNLTVTVGGDFPKIVLTKPASYKNYWGELMVEGFDRGQPVPLNFDVSIAAPYTITNVIVYYGSSSPIVISKPPYSVEVIPHGNYNFINVDAYADSGAIASSDPIVIAAHLNVTIAFVAPVHPVVVGQPTALQLAITDPWNAMEGAYYKYSSSDASWNWQTIAIVSNTDAVYWTPPATGNYTLYAGSDMGAGAQFNVTVVNPEILNPTIVTPDDGQTAYAGVSVPIGVSFDDTNNAFAGVEIFANGTSLGRVTNTVFNWVPTQTNDYVLTAKVYDNDGNAYDATNSVMVSVITAPRPGLTIVAPGEGSRVRANVNTVVIADLDDPATIITNVQFWVDDAILGQNSTYFSWFPSQLGNHVLQATALTMMGESITSAPVNVTVAVMYPPAVSLLSPTNNERFAPGTWPTLNGLATDADGSITNLSLTLDTTVLGSTNDAALNLAASDIAPGWHTATASATDNDGLSTSTSVVNFFVGRQPNLALSLPDQLAARALSATEIQLTWVPVSTNGLLQSVLIERWDAAQSLWTELARPVVGSSNFTDSALSPETNYRYRVACLDTNGYRSAYSAEADASTRTIVPDFTVIDLSAAIARSLTNLSTGGNILTNGELTHYDIRRTVATGSAHAATVLGTNAVPLSLAVARFKERWPQIQLDYDPVLLSPKSILPRLGFLTGPGGSGITVSDATAQMFDPNDPYRPLKAFLQEQSALFGFNDEALTNAAVQRDYVSPSTGTRTVVWQQQVAGVQVFNGLLIGNITALGELACLSSEFIPAPTKAANPDQVAAVLAGTSLPVSSAQALLTAVTNCGDLFTAEAISIKVNPQGVAQSLTLAATNGIKGDAYAELTWFPSSRNELKLAWQVIFTSQWRNEMYLAVISASDNQILYRRDLTADSTEASYRVYANSSPAPMLPGLSSPSTTQAPAIDRAFLTFSALDANASPSGWVKDGNIETSGNNVDAHLDRNDDNLADLPRPAGNPVGNFDFTLDLTSSPDNYGDAAVAQLFYWNNWMHDVLYGFGFTESSGNFQYDNFGRGGFGGDAVQADAQDGLRQGDSQHRNNANMSTPPDGYPPRMQMYVFDGATPARDGSLDGEIVLHEYAHGISSRLIGGGAGIDALQTAGMGEGWSDFYALALLANPASDVDATYPIGGYVTYHGFGSTFEENYYYGIRHYPYCTDTNKNPLTFADIDPAQAKPHLGVPRNPLLGAFQSSQAREVHSQGEVWGMMLWELRASLIKKYGANQANDLTLQLVTDGLKLSPVNPNFVQARDAILLADRIYTGGANTAEIWGAFAKRGLGYSATAPESHTSSGVRESYEVAPVLVTESVEIQGGNGNGIVETNEDNNLLLVVHNQGAGAATRVSGMVTTTTPGVQILQSQSDYVEFPQGSSRTNSTWFQIRTLPEFEDGMPIDLSFVITSDQLTQTNSLRLYTGNTGSELPPGGDEASAALVLRSSEMQGLAPVDLKNLEPLWMADNADCLLKVKGSIGKYVLWKHDGTLPQLIVTNNFIAHHLTHNGTVVGTVTATNTLDEWTNQVQHSWGARWDFDSNVPVPLTKTNELPLTVANAYTWPKDAGLTPYCGSVYSSVLTNVYGESVLLTNVTSYPTLYEVWDMNSSGVSVGALSLQVDFAKQLVYFDSLGVMDWFTATERGLDAGTGRSVFATMTEYWPQLTTAAQFNSAKNWRWLGPLNWQSTVSYATLVNDAGMIAGASAVFLGDSALDTLRPTHAFRVTGTAQCAPYASIAQDLGVLPNGLHSFPRAMNQAGDVVGYSDFDIFSGAGSTSGGQITHGVVWPANGNSIIELEVLGGFSNFPKGYGDAYDINDLRQIVGESLGFGSLPLSPITINPGSSAATLWQPKTLIFGNTPSWEVNDLNFRLTDPAWYVWRSVGINHDGLILADAVKAEFDAGSSTYQAKPHAALLVPITAVSRDRFFEGTIDLPSDVTPSDVFVSFTLKQLNEWTGEETKQIIASRFGMERIYASREVAFQKVGEKIAAKISAALGGGEEQEPYTDKVIVYRDGQQPQRLHFVGYSPLFGTLQIETWVQGRIWPTVEHKLEKDGAFNEFAQHLDDYCAGNSQLIPNNDVPHPILSVAPDPLDFGTGQLINLYKGQSYSHDTDPLDLYQKALSALMLESLIKDEFKLPLAYYWGMGHGFTDGVVFDAEGIKEAAEIGALAIVISKSPYYQSVFISKVANVAVVAYKSRAETFDPLMTYLGTLKAEDFPKIACNLGKSLYAEWATKAQADAGWIYEGQPLESNPEGLKKYTEGYISGFIGEQVFITLLTAGGVKYAEAARLPEVVVKTIEALESARGGAVGVALTGANTVRAGVLATYLTYAAKAPSESWLRRMAQSPFKLETYLKGTTFGNETLDKLFEELSRNGCFCADRILREMPNTRNFIPLQTAPEKLEQFMKRDAEVSTKLAREIPPGPWAGTEGLVKILDNLFPSGQPDRVPDLLKALDIDNNPIARQALVETLNTASSKSSDAILSEGLKASSRFADAFPIFYYHADRSVFKYLQVIGERDGKAFVAISARTDGGYHYVSRETGDTSRKIIELFQLPDQSYKYPNLPDTTGRYRFVLESVQVKNDLTIPRGFNHSPPPGTGNIMALEPLCVDNPARGANSTPRGQQFKTQQGFTAYIEDTENNGHVLTIQEILDILNQVTGSP